MDKCDLLEWVSCTHDYMSYTSEPCTPHLTCVRSECKISDNERGENFRNLFNIDDSSWKTSKGLHLSVLTSAYHRVEIGIALNVIAYPKYCVFIIIIFFFFYYHFFFLFFFIFFFYCCFFFSFLHFSPSSAPSSFSSSSAFRCKSKDCDLQLQLGYICDEQEHHRSDVS